MCTVRARIAVASRSGFVRAASGDPARARRHPQGFGVGPVGVKLPAQRVEVLLKPRNLGVARVECLPEPLLKLRERTLRVLFCDPMAFRLCAQLAVAIDDDGLEPGALRHVLSRDLFECLKRGLQPIERLTDLTIPRRRPAEAPTRSSTGRVRGPVAPPRRCCEDVAIDPASCRAAVEASRVPV